MKKNDSIASLVLNNPSLLFVIERFGIKLGFQEKTIAEVCEEYQLSASLFSGVCNLYINPTKIAAFEIKAEELGMLINYLRNSHSYYKTEVLPKIAKQIAVITQDNNDEVSFALIKRFFEEYKNEVLKHLDYEENIAFPYALSLASGKEQTLGYRINNYKNNHDNIETKLYDLKNLLIKYLPEKEKQIHRRDLLLSLFRFEEDLHIHTLIEDHILVTAVEEIENSFS